MRPPEKARYDPRPWGAIRAVNRRQRTRDSRGRLSRPVTALTLAAIASAACGPQPVSERPRIVATVLPLAGIVDRIAPDLVEVSVLIPPGANPVTHEPSLSHLRDASAADVIFQVGHPAFAWESTWLDDLAQSKAAVRVSVATDCAAVPDDPHVWLSPACARAMATTMADALVTVLPAARDSIRRSLDAFMAEVDDVSAVAGLRLAGRPGAAFLTLHPAWGYVAREYGLEQLAILEHGSGDTGPGELAAVIERARREGLRDVIAQPQFSAGPAELVADELGGRVLLLDPLTRDWSAGMREAIEVIGGEVNR